MVVRQVVIEGDSRVIEEVVVLTQAIEVEVVILIKTIVVVLIISEEDIVDHHKM